MTVLEQDEKVVKEMGKRHIEMNSYSIKYATEFGEIARLTSTHKPASIKKRFSTAIEILWAKGVCNKRFNGKKITYVFI
jgi:hypothetical protein